MPKIVECYFSKFSITKDSFDKPIYDKPIPGGGMFNELTLDFNSKHSIIYQCQKRFKCFLLTIFLQLSFLNSYY